MLVILTPDSCPSPPATYHLTPVVSTRFPLSDRISFVFIYILAWSQGFPQWSFVFNNIRASLRQKKNSFPRLVGFLEPQDKLSE